MNQFQLKLILSFFFLRGTNRGGGSTAEQSTKRRAMGLGLVAAGKAGEGEGGGGLFGGGTARGRRGKERRTGEAGEFR